MDSSSRCVYVAMVTREKTFRWNSSYLACRCFIYKKNNKPYHGLWRLLRGLMQQLQYGKIIHFFHFDAIGVSSSMNLVMISLVCLDHVPALSLIHSSNVLLNGIWWQLGLLPGIGPPPSTCRPGTMKWKISPSHTLRSVTPIAPSNALAQFVLTIPR